MKKADAALQEFAVRLPYHVTVDVRELPQSVIFELIALMRVENESLRIAMTGIWGTREPKEGQGVLTAKEKEFLTETSVKRKVFGANINTLIRETSRRREGRKRRGASSFERHFIKAVEAMLDPETCEKLRQAAKASVQAEEEEFQAAAAQQARDAVATSYTTQVLRELEGERERNRSRIELETPRHPHTFDDGVISVFAMSAGLPGLGRKH